MTDCVDSADPRADVRLRGTSSGGVSRSYTVDLRFIDGNGQVLGRGSETVRLRGRETKLVRVAMSNPDQADQVASCRVDRVR